MKIKINTLVVDDRRLYAQEVRDAIVQRNTVSELVEYDATVLCSRNVYEEARAYIADAMRRGIHIDLFFSDYHLGGGESETGIDLFKLFNNSENRSFRVLHSNTTKRFEERKKEYQLIFDEFAKSKRSEDVGKILLDFEEGIAKVKLFGNPKLYKKYYNEAKAFALTKNAALYIGEFKLIDIVSIETHNNEHTITYRKYADEKILLHTVPRSGEIYRQENLIDANLGFARINRSQTVNLLWVSKIEYINKKIIFITPDSKLRSLIVYNFSNNIDYMDTYAPYLSDISGNLHPYFFSV